MASAFNMHVIFMGRAFDEECKKVALIIFAELFPWRYFIFFFLLKPVLWADFVICLKKNNPIIAVVFFYFSICK